MASSPVPKAPVEAKPPTGEKPVEVKTRDVPAKSSPSNPVTPTKTLPPSSPPSSGDATGTIVIAVVVIIGSSLVKDVYHGSPTIRPVVTGMMLGGVLLILATFAPTLAKMLAIIGMVGALMTNGAELTQVTGNVGKNQPNPSTHSQVN